MTIEQSSHTELLRLSALETLEAAYRVVLGEKFDIEVRAVAEELFWYSAEMSESETFRLWALECLTRQGDNEWIFAPLRVSERKLMMAELGIASADIIGRGPEYLSGLCLAHLGLPVNALAGLEQLRLDFEQLEEMVTLGSDERAAVLARQRAERLLKYLLHFYCSTPSVAHFLRLLQSPGNLNVPKRINEALTQNASSPEVALVHLFKEDDWADLGFLALALRKFSSRIEAALEAHPSGARLVLFTAAEHESFNQLSAALQNYTHDKPSTLFTRQESFRIASKGMNEAIARMARRRIIPSEYVVLEIGSSLAGGFFRARDAAGLVRSFCTATAPSVGQRVTLIASADAEYASCSWTEAAW